MRLCAVRAYLRVHAVHLQHFEVDAAELHNVAVPDRLGHAVIGLENRDDLAAATGWDEEEKAGVGARK